MAVLEQIRVKFGVLISVIIALALLSFIIDPSTIESALQTMSSKYDVGKINGKSVSYTDFLDDVDRFTTINELITGSSVQSEEQRVQINNAAWQELVDKYLFVDQAKKAGLTVGKDELLALTTGEMVSPVLAQNQVFMDENGMFSREAFVNFVNSVDTDPSGQLRAYWQYLQNTMFAQQYYTKYGSLFAASDYQNPLLLQKTIAENNETANVDFVLVPFGYTPDSTIVVADKEIKDYYAAHKKFFKQAASRELEYVVFEVRPSESDIEAVNNSIAAIYEDFAATDNVKNFLTKNSDRGYTEYWFRDGELSTISSQVSTFVNENKPGAVSPIVQDGDSFFAVKVLAEAMIPEQIEVRAMGVLETEITDSLLTALRLTEPMSLTQTYMIPGCESLLTADLNKPQIIKTAQNGNVLCEVVEKSELVSKKQVAILEKQIVASKETINGYYSQANKFSSLAGKKYDGYRKAVDSLGVYSHPVSNVLESTNVYGSIDNAKEITRWAFEAKKGNVSEIFTINNNYFIVATLTNIHNEGTASLKEVAAGIRERLYSEKLAAAKEAEVAAKIAGKTDLEEIAEVLGTTVSNQEAVTFSSVSNQGLDPAFLGAVASAEVGKVSKPVAGTLGIYVFRVNGRDMGSFYTEDDAKTFAAQIGQYNAQMILPVMSEDKVTDNRARFF